MGTTLSPLGGGAYLLLPVADAKLADVVAAVLGAPAAPPVQTPPVETPPVETPPVETPPVETPPVQTPPVQTPPVTTPTQTPPASGYTDIGLDPAFYTPVTTGDRSPNGWMLDGAKPVPTHTWGGAPSADITPANEYRCYQAIGDKGVLNYVPPGPFQFGLEIGGNVGFTSVTVQAKNPAWPPPVAFNAVQQVWGKAAMIGSGAFDPGGNELFPTDIHVAGFLFTNNGNKNSPSSGDGALYGEAYSRLFVDLCAFENNKDGIFTNYKAHELHVSRSAFSVKQGNGAADGKSHDVYTSARINTFRQVIIGGLSTGNGIKFRKEQALRPGEQYDVVIDQSFLAGSNGRAFDPCWGGQSLIANSVYVQLPNSGSVNEIAIDEETSNPQAPSVTIFRNTLIVVTRYGTLFMVRPGDTLDFSAAKFLFLKTDNLAPTLTIQTALNGQPGGAVTVKGLPYPTKDDGQGNLLVQIPPGDILDAGRMPSVPSDPTTLVSYLTPLLPGPIVPVL